MEYIENYLNGTSNLVRVTKSWVTVEVPSGLPSSEVGRRLMNLEFELRDNVNSNIEVFLQPKQDKNRLRKLRGVEVIDNE